MASTTDRERAGFRWDPDRYARFAAPRRRAAEDLLARVRLDAPRRVVDLGCGSGPVTALLAARWPEAEIVAIDRSEEMLSRARSSGVRARFERGDLAAWSAADPVDLVFANASLHWLEDHATLVPRLLAQVAPGGVLAVQMPANFEEPSHRAMRETLADGGEGGAPLGDASLRARHAAPRVAEPARYHDLLTPIAREVDLWVTTYVHVLAGLDAVLEWVQGSALRPILAALEGDECERFLARYAERLRAAYPPRPGGRTLFPFPRLFFVARR